MIPALFAIAVGLFVCGFGLYRLAGAVADLADTQLERNGIERRRTP